MAYSRITSWQINGETVTDFILGGAKITADDECSHEIQRRLLLGRKAMTNLDNILKSRCITLPTNVDMVKALLFAIRVVSSVYLRLLIFLPVLLTSACASSSLTFCMLYYAYKLNKQGDNIEP